MNAKSILAISTHLEPCTRYGGPAISLFRLLKYFERNNYHINALSSNPDESLKTKQNNFYNQQFKSNILKKYGFSIILFINIFFKIPKNKFIFINGLSNFPLLIATFFSLRFKKKTFIFTRGGLESSRTKNWNFLKRFLYKINISLILKIHSFGNLTLIYQSKDEKDKSILSNLPFIIVANYEALKKQKFKKNDKCKIIFAGRENHDKGTDRLTSLINSIHKLDLSNNVIINVAKAGSQSKTELEFLSEKYDFVNLYHNLNKSDLNTLYKDSDILFLPSRFENFGNSAVEALSKGCILSVTHETHWGRLLDINCAIKVSEITKIILQWNSISNDELDKMYQKTFDYVNSNFLEPYSFDRLKTLLETYE